MSAQQLLKKKELKSMLKGFQTEINELKRNVRDENKQLRSMLKGFQTEINELKRKVSATTDMVLQFCRLGWIQYGTSCYLANSTKQKSWTSAKLECERYGSKLVEIENEAENNFLKNYLIQDKGRYWTGGNDRFREGRWVWASSGNVFRYSNWADGEPNNVRYIEDCMEIYMPKRAWADADCQKENKFICEHFSRS
uniref:Galactose-specific lectin nattectin-like isoform X2 n=1 Tax=Crassostrea virginica TaxID=6565 RepID=A0A8B8EB69_CRAVI|nr:galactose-specific lectin nattectin-like isoform X2 [Crassostrea virginica]